MRKLISLFLVLVMFLMLAPTALAAENLPVSEASIAFGTIQTWSGDYSTPKSFTITNTFATSTDVTITCDSGVKISVNGSAYGSSQSFNNFASPTNPLITVRVLPTDSTVSPNPKTGNITIAYSGSDYTSPKTIPFSYTVSTAASAQSIGLYYDTAMSSLLSGTNYYFPSQYVGYTPGSLTFYIHNTGSQALTPVSVAFGVANYFEVTSPPANTIALPGYVSATIRPKAGLPAGTYWSDVIVSAGTASQSFRVYFTVNSIGGSSTSNYENRTLIDYVTGVRVSGLSIHNSAALSVTQNSLHSAGLCTACDTIRNYMSNGQVLSIYNISLTRGHAGTVNVSIPVSSGYNGNRLTMVHCNGGILESLDVYASSGMVTGSFSSLSPFAVLSSQYIGAGNNTGSSNGIGPPKTDDPISYKALGELVILLTAVTGFIVMRSKKRAKR